jgi:hypothetical protein
MITLTCAFATLCQLDGTCDNGPLKIIINYEDRSAQVAMLDWGAEPFPVMRLFNAEAAAPTAIPKVEQFISAGGGLLPQIMVTLQTETGDAVFTTHRVWGKPDAISGAGTCAEGT